MEGGEEKRRKQLDLRGLFSGSKVEVQVPPKRGPGRPRKLPPEGVVVAIEAGLTEDEKRLGERVDPGPLAQVLEDALAAQGVVVEAGKEPRHYEVCRKRGRSLGGLRVSGCG